MIPNTTPYKINLVSNKYILQIVDTRLWSLIKFHFLLSNHITKKEFSTFEELVEAAYLYRDKSYIKLGFYTKQTYKHSKLDSNFTLKTYIPTALIFN